MLTKQNDMFKLAINLHNLLNWFHDLIFVRIFLDSICSKM